MAYSGHVPTPFEGMMSPCARRNMRALCDVCTVAAATVVCSLKIGSFVRGCCTISSLLHDFLIGFNDCLSGWGLPDVAADQTWSEQDACYVLVADIRPEWSYRFDTGASPCDTSKTSKESNIS